MNEIIVFVYLKEGGKAKVLSFEQSKAEHKTLIEDGWKHVDTLNACVFIEYVYKTKNKWMK